MTKVKGNIKTEVIKVVTAIGGIVILEGLAIQQGINGVTFTIAIVAIAGLGGYELRDVIDIVKDKLPEK